MYEEADALSVGRKTPPILVVSASGQALSFIENAYGEFESKIYRDECADMDFKILDGVECIVFNGMDEYVTKISGEIVDNILKKNKNAE